MVQNFSEKSCRKIWWNGGGSRQPRRQKKVLAVTEKVVTFAEPAAGVAEGEKKTFEMMLQTI